MTSATSRSLQNSWNTAWQTAPPPACTTLRNLDNVVEWGRACVFAVEDGEPLPFSINTACMPWVTSSIYPSPSAFYSPATACPVSWTAVATQTAGAQQWINGETALRCCPSGFDSDGGVGCRPGSSGTWPVVECGDADAEENSLRTYSGAAWPASVRPSITALELRYQASDIGVASARPSSTGLNAARGGNTGLSTGGIIAIAVVLPLVSIIGALLWWRRRNRKRTARQATNLFNEKGGHRPSSFESIQADHHVSGSKNAQLAAVGPGTASTTAMGRGNVQHEIPEWNAELDASEAERRVFEASPDTVIPVSSITLTNDISELGGMARMQRKPIAPVEIDGTPIVSEIGDAYTPYRPGANAS